MKLWPTFIISKGRAGSAIVHSELDPTLVVEPAEAELYRRSFPSSRLALLPESGQGIAYVRNWVKAQASGWYWILDDDVTGFGLVKDGKCHRASATEVLLKAQGVIAGVPDAAAGSLSYRQFAWSAQKEAALDRSVEVVGAIHPERAKWFQYRKRVALKEDRDFAMQIVSSGLRTVIAARCYFETKPIAQAEGGLAEEYRAKRDEESSLEMARLWPGAVTLKKNSRGRTDIAIDWRSLKPRVK